MAFIDKELTEYFESTERTNLLLSRIESMFGRICGRLDDLYQERKEFGRFNIAGTDYILVCSMAESWLSGFVVRLPGAKTGIYMSGAQTTLPTRLVGPVYETLLREVVNHFVELIPGLEEDMREFMSAAPRPR